MRKLTIPIAFFIAFVAALAGAQVPFPQTLPAFTVVGRMAPTSGPSEAIPFDVLVPNLFSVGFCNTANATLVNSTANGWGCQVPLAVASGGTNCTAASGTCLDNITGFASTGFVKRTGAGTYSFIADPVPVGNGGLGITFGTSGGIPYFSGSTTIASSGALTANLPVIGGGAGVAPTVGTRSGNTTSFATTSGTLTNGNCVKIDASGNLVDNAAACGVPNFPTLAKSANYTTVASDNGKCIAVTTGA